LRFHKTDAAEVIDISVLRIGALCINDV